jgi:hypothetical protein
MRTVLVLIAAAERATRLRVLRVLDGIRVGPFPSHSIRVQ